MNSIVPALAGKSLLITGASSGIGRAAAFACARQGAKLMLGDLSCEAGEEVAAAIRDKGGSALFSACDVRVDAQVRGLVESAVGAYGRLDGAFNNAGIEGEISPLDEVSEELFSRVLDINVTGVWRCMRAEIPYLSRHGGAIVNTSSIAGLIGAGGLSPYVASKHAVIGLTKAAAIEYAKAGIRVNAVCPGVIATPMLDRLAEGRPGLIEGLLAFKPMGRLGLPEEVAEAVVWLLSDASSFTTGHALTVDGGYVAQ